MSRMSRMSYTLSAKLCSVVWRRLWHRRRRVEMRRQGGHNWVSASVSASSRIPEDCSHAKRMSHVSETRAECRTEVEGRGVSVPEYGSAGRRHAVMREMSRDPQHTPHPTVLLAPSSRSALDIHSRTSQRREPWIHNRLVQDMRSGMESDVF